MHLTIREKEKLLLYLAAQVAYSRKNKGLKLNYSESIAIISSEIIEGAREGKTVTQLQTEAKNLIKKEDVLEGVPEMTDCVQVEATFSDGTKMVTVLNPIQ